MVLSSVYYPWIHSTIDVENLRASTHYFKSPFSQTCNRLERSLSWMIVSNMLWKLAELTDEAINQFWKLDTAMEILDAAVPGKAIALFATLNADDTHLESTLDDQDHQGQLQHLHHLSCMQPLLLLKMFNLILALWSSNTKVLSGYLSGIMPCL